MRRQSVFVFDEDVDTNWEARSKSGPSRPIDDVPSGSDGLHALSPGSVYDLASLAPTRPNTLNDCSPAP